MKKQALALIGAGKWGKNLARNFDRLQVLHTILDVNESVLDEYQKIYPNTFMTSNMHSVLENNEITAVAIAAPSHLHYPLAKQALVSGKDVYVEKPLCLSVSDAEDLEKIADEKNKVLMCGHILQYHPCMLALENMVRENAFGALQSVHCSRLNFGAVRETESALLDLAPHDISAVLSLCGSKLPVCIACTGKGLIFEDIEDFVHVYMEFEEGIAAEIHVSRMHPFKEQKLVVIGSKKMAVFDDTKPWNEKLIVYENEVSISKSGVVSLSKGLPQTITIQEKEPLYEECSHFVDCCAKKARPRSDSREAIRVQRVLEVCQESLSQRKKTKSYLN